MEAGYIDDPYAGMFTAGGNIKADGTFVKLSTAADLTVLAAGAGDRPFGIAMTQHRNPPYETLDDGFVAVAGEGVGVAIPGRIVPLRVGAAVTRGDYLKPDADGCGITSSTGNIHGARALQSATVAGSMIFAFIEIGTTP